MFDEPTRAVITRWQAARGYPEVRLPQQAAAQGAADGNRRNDAHRQLERLGGEKAGPPRATQHWWRDGGGGSGGGGAAPHRGGADPGAPSSAAWWAACWAARSDADRPIRQRQCQPRNANQKPGSRRAFQFGIRCQCFLQSACPSVNLTSLSPPEVSRHISTSLPAGIGLAQVICGLLSYLVVENLQVTIQDASLASEFVIMILATSSPGKMTQLNGTDSADAVRRQQADQQQVQDRDKTDQKDDCKPGGRECIDAAGPICRPLFAARH